MKEPTTTAEAARDGWSMAFSYACGRNAVLSPAALAAFRPARIERFRCTACDRLTNAAMLLPPGWKPDRS